MIPTKRGQIVKFHTPYEDEDPNQLFVTLEVIDDGNRSRVKIYPLGYGNAFAPINLVWLRDLEVDEGQTFELDYYLEHVKHELF
jgi:hypothetical protein